MPAACVFSRRSQMLATPETWLEIVPPVHQLWGWQDMPHLTLMTFAHRKSLATLAGQSRPRGMGKSSLTAP